MFAVFGLLNFDSPHGIPFIVGILPLFRKLIQSAGVILRQIDFFQQLFTEMGFGYLAFEKIQVTFRIIARPTDGLHECRFANGVHTADIKVIIMARFDIDTGSYPVQRRAKIAGCGFNLPDISNPFFREPELKLYRRVINRKMRRGGYLKIARCQLNPRRRCRGGNPERYRRRVSLLPPGIYCPDCQPVVPQRQLREAVCGFRRPGRADQPLTAVIRCHGQAKHKAHPLHHLRRVPARQHLIFPAVCGDFGSQVLHCWRRDTIHRAALVAVKVRPVIHDGLFFRYMLHGGDGIRAVIVLTDTHAAEQALAQRRQLQPPYAVSGNAVRNTAHFYLHAVGDGLDLHADRIATSVNQAYQRGTGGWQRDFTVERQRPGLAVHSQHAPADADPRIVIIADFNNITRHMAKPFGTHAEIHGLRLQQLRFNQPQPGAVCLPPAGTAKGIHLRNITTVTGNGLRIFNKLCRRLPAVVRVNPVHLNGIMAVLQGAEAVAERRAIIRHHHITAVIGPHLI
ncbi:hypothetical protein EC131719_04894 [Escherichia coli O145:H28]|nr:hypothetical protein BvCmsNSP007_00449 [Escherichia coli]GEE12383.1 hypothetical protein ECH27V05_03944 [Escherichia coli O145:H28]GEE28402.1 hypothetical protein EC1380_00280 [Escherichia coli O145:H28]GEE34258.1 hypothetical protein EC131719_04894 [Escherichia coli O145:H28]GEE39711.1 hypothetical protein EC131990_01156 [Escherichia coli O145:H28]